MLIKSLLPVLAIVLSVAMQSNAFAGFQVAAQGAADVNTSNYGFASSPNILLGVQATADVSYPFQLGIAYEHNGLSYNDGSSGDLRFYGLIGRFHFVTPLFVDVQAGLGVRDGVGASFSWGVGVGYSFPLISSIDIAPRVGYRSVPDGGIERSLFDFGAVVNFKFY